MSRLIICVLVAGLMANTPAFAQNTDRGVCRGVLTIFSAVREACTFEQRSAGDNASQQKPDPAQPRWTRNGAVPVQNSSAPNSVTVFSVDECIGPVVNGVCHGAILDSGRHHPTCHGEMLNGQCTGPMF